MLKQTGTVDSSNIIGKKANTYSISLANIPTQPIDDKLWTAVMTYRNDLIRIISVRRSKRQRWHFVKVSDFDKKFDDNKDDIIGDLDLSTLRRPIQPLKRVNVDFPSWMVKSLDREASRIGITCQSIIKVWLAGRLEAGEANKNIKTDHLHER